ncbi:DUF1642 domain-containing protein [Lactococcus lactis]|uniref:DUF1642 domain-containing protein n=1 Tax=Lactococcus lactis TaxID=1358 RepID=UPI00288CB8DE|nr:DUF1642 domain-containing protein [Lactococcus lactis]MDT2858922.1 DUF1642 domain-containing protein [Lactococcus lactis]MDT2904355.1 DUF1642 domain-containing protein [Lactococcus lactis]MDT2917551.1 DUF1642 domain-containing protein [Lactococcus lactis]MDT2926781.1 DUF1642 domain-containing protein [Lactococcus lactis]
MTKFEEKLEKLPIKTIQHPVGDTKYYKAVHVKTLIAQADEEIATLKSQLQQQALPVVPECVAEWIDKNISVAHNAELMIHNILICAIDNKNRYLFPLEVEKFVLKNPITFLNAIITGKYEVEKPQLFYLKAKELLVVGDYDHVEDLWLDWNKNFTPKKQDAHKFTQQEIDSMQTGSYEQIEVTE